MAAGMAGVSHAATGTAASAETAACVDGQAVRFGGMNWESNLLLVEIERRIVETGYDCRTSIEPGENPHAGDAVKPFGATIRWCIPAVPCDQTTARPADKNIHHISVKMTWPETWRIDWAATPPLRAQGCRAAKSKGLVPHVKRPAILFGHTE